METRPRPGPLYKAPARLQAQGVIGPVQSHDRPRPCQLTALGAATLRAQLDAQRRVAAFDRRPVRVASGHADPFRPGVQALARALPAGAVTAFGPGCHDDAFFAAQQPPSLTFPAAHLA